MNKVQKSVLTIFIPLIIIIAALGITNAISYDGSFDWEETWFIWVIALGLISFFLYRLFRNKK